MSRETRFPLPPNATIGILGGGQLGRMSALAAAELGYRCHVYAPDAGSPGMQVAAAHTVAGYEDAEALAAFAAAVDVVTFEFENVPARTLEILEPLVPCRPGRKALAVCQDRLQEKAFLEAAGVPVAPWRAVHSLEDLETAIGAIGLPAVLKTTRLGYDGRGQAVIRAPEEAAAAFTRLEPKPLILEAFVPFTQEISAVAARGADGATAVYDAVENHHRHHILDLSFAPARIPQVVAESARRHAARVAEALELVGVLAVEFFLLPDGRLLGNEIAPRPHNSGHWTMDACQSSQFHQHMRAVAGLPLGSPRRHSDAVMRNLVGPEGMARLAPLLGCPDVSVHLYGKASAREGRKMGHANRLFPAGTLAAATDEALLSGL
ncbi:5-(carboxyamino)imidazole ribonucleotide synthase [Pseudoroseomonas rhizosphaerae]|uniref:N5-carboxyaminoimidazole ribonucleotide synthase n=2 Tax=Teichococcus rhizosphaerae TaxID=1335062 RepID=A0A2C7A8B4_9PROT|nr:5-(carboxyamino)imidazole ribonucleotide synthase [Pseudoroseomonas rhizosphaerae]PHK93595.1 5-(carboxyamino)imidazole ribonucleotide synthase [Pseudoroseomonas rhizosphaerae]